MQNNCSQNGNTNQNPYYGYQANQTNSKSTSVEHNIRGQDPYGRQNNYGQNLMNN